MSDSTPPEAAAPKKASGGGASKIVPLLLVLNLGASGFVVFKMMTAPAVAEAAPAAGAAAAKPGEAEHAVKGPVVPLDPFVVNLDEPGSPRYLKTTISLELESEEVIAELEQQKQPVRDQVLGYLSGLKVADTLGEANKKKIRDGILGHVVDAVGKGKVRRLFLSEFMVQ